MLGRVAVIHDWLTGMRGGEKVQDENAEEHRQALEKYCIDLTERAETHALTIFAANLRGLLLQPPLRKDPSN